MRIDMKPVFEISLVFGMAAKMRVNTSFERLFIYVGPKITFCCFLYTTTFVHGHIPTATAKWHSAENRSMIS